MADPSQLSADKVVSLLGLEPHPEGGCFRETFRDQSTVAPDHRAASTAIYFLLRSGEVSRWHRIDAAEVWHWYAGAPLELEWAKVLPGQADRLVLGNVLTDGQRPQAVIQPGYWQRARSLGGWSLLGCTVAPGFTFETFSIWPGETA